MTGIQNFSLISQEYVLRSPCTKFRTLIPKIGIVGAIWSSDKKVWKYNISVNRYQIFLHVVDRHEKTDFFMLITFLAWGIFLIHDTWKKIKKWPEPNIFLYPKISSVIRVNHAKEFLKYVLYFHTFLLELQMAASIPILRIDV